MVRAAQPLPAAESGSQIAAQPQVVAEPYVRVVKSPHDWEAPPWVGSPSIAKTASGRLLVCHDLFGTKENESSPSAYMHASDDGGRTWKPLARIPGLYWPSLFRCVSGVYAIGVDRSFKTADNHIVIARASEDGRRWSEPARLTAPGLVCHTGNKGALVSRGRVTYSFELVPALFNPLPRTTLLGTMSAAESDLDARDIEVEVADPSVFVAHTLVAVEDGKAALHCRVLDAGPGKRIVLRPERWAGAAEGRPQNSPGPWRFAAGTPLHIVSGMSKGLNRDFWETAIDADEKADLCDARVWRKANAIGNPCYTHRKVLKELFGFDYELRGHWLEGVLVRLEHPGGSGQIVNILRAANQVTPNLSARVIVEDGAGQLRCRFDRMGFDPGLGCVHCYAMYDAPSRLYWMTSNVNRDSTRFEPSRERANLALFYSGNCVDWFMAGLVAYAPDMIHSFNYSHFTIDGDDLLVISRSHVESPLTESTRRGGQASAHDSNAATFHRVRNFRSIANLEFLRYKTG